MRSAARLTSSDDLRSAIWPGAMAAVWACLYGWGLTVALMLLAGGGGDSVLASVRAASRIWLVAQGSGLDVDGVAVTFVPAGGVLLAVLIVVVAARGRAREPVSEPAAFAATAAGVYAVIASIVTAVSNDGSATVPMVRAALVTFALAGSGAAIGYALAQGVPPAWWPQDRPELRAVLRGAATSVVGVMTVSFLLVVIGLARHVEQAGSLWAMLDPGLAGGIALAVVCVLLVPTLCLWAASALLGPGFQVGTDTSVDLTSSHLGHVPGLPVLAALPAPGEFPAWTFVLALVPAAAAARAGWRLVRRGDVVLATDFWRGVGIAASAGAVGAVVLALLVGTASGAVGPGRMADMGPESSWSLLAALPFMAVAAGIGAMAAHYRGSRARPA